MKKAVQCTPHLNGECGMSALAMVLMLTAVVGAMAMVLPDMFNQVDLGARIVISKSSAVLAKENVAAMLDNDAVLGASLRHPANTGALACLLTAGATCPFNAGAPVTISLSDAEGNLILDAGSGASGLTFAGEPCNTFGTAGNLNCVYRFAVTLECVGACTPTTFTAGTVVPDSPKLRIRSIFDFKPVDAKLAGTLNLGSTSPYNVDFDRGGKNTATVAKFCAALGGNFNQQNLKCQSALGPSTFDCRTITGSNHAWFAGFDPSGAPKCMLDGMVNAACPNGSAVRGYNEMGALICGGF